MCELSSFGFTCRHVDLLFNLFYVWYLLNHIDTFFLIKWTDESDLHDVVSSKMVVPPDDLTIMEVDPGTKVKVLFNGRYYKAQVIDRG